jgi:DNA-binding transcriptional LysR family regulator
MEIYQLKHFIAIVETGSFTRGAERCGVTQPAISASLAKLESELGTKLFERRKRLLATTAAGYRVLDMARSVLKACSEIKADLRAGAFPRRVRVGVAETVPARRVGALVAAYLRNAEEQGVEIIEGSHPDLERRLALGKVDALITLMSGSRRRGGPIKTKHLYNDAFLLFAVKRHRFAGRSTVELGDLDGEPFISRTRCEASEQVTRALIAKGIRPSVVYRTDHDARALEMVAAGLGVALMPASYGVPEVACIPVRDFPVARSVVLAWRKDDDRESVHRFLGFASTHDWKGTERAAQAK